MAKETPNRAGRPVPDRGRAAREALLDAAITLLAERGTYGVSLRAVARRAGVSYGLVHYYFETKNALLHRALGRAVARRRPGSPGRDEWGPRVIENPPSDTAVRAVFHLALDWDTYGDVFAGSPVATARVGRLQELYGDDVDEFRLRSAYAASFCLQMAWLVLAPQQLAVATASPAEAEAIRGFVKEVVHAILPLALQPGPPRPARATRPTPAPAPAPSSETTLSTATRPAPADARVALLDAATALLAERGSYGVSIREVAKRAGVNYGLVHYYFATKSELLVQALRLELSRYQAAVAAVGEWSPMLIEHPPAETTWRSFVHLALDWDSYRSAFDGFTPIAAARMQQLRTMYADIDESRLRAAYITSLCLQIGWLVLAPQQLDAAGASPAQGEQMQDFIVEVDQVILDVARRGRL